MESFKDLSKEIKAALYDRVGDPLISSFVFFFVTWNWRFFYMLVRPGNASTESAIESAISYFDWSSIIAPITFSLLYVFGYSWLRKHVVAYWYMRQTNALNAKRRAENSKLLTQEEGQRLRDQAEDEGRKLIARLEEQTRANTAFREFIVHFAQQWVGRGKGTSTFALYESYTATSGNGVYAITQSGNRVTDVEFSNSQSQKYVYVFERAGMGSHVLGAAEGSIVPVPEIMKNNPAVKKLHFMSTKELLTEEQLSERVAAKQSAITLVQFTRIDEFTAKFDRVTTQ